MGASIYGNEVGSTEDKKDQWVHKFWLGIQDSDVSDYLETQYLLADLYVEDEADIQEKVAELKAEFKKTYRIEYDSFIDSDELNKSAYKTPKRKTLLAKQQLASRIALGENLLKTIANMKTAGISEQQLTIEC